MSTINQSDSSDVSDPSKPAKAARIRAPKTPLNPQPARPRVLRAADLCPRISVAEADRRFIRVCVKFLASKKETLKLNRTVAPKHQSEH